RVAALLSGDPVMIQEYIDGIDRHANTALFFWPDADITSDEFTRKPDGQRQAGKTTNFLVLYKGGAFKLQETIMRDTGRVVSLKKCQEAIWACYSKYKRFGAWQQELLDTVASQGYLELITGWSRTWSKGTPKGSVINEICDFPVQTIAAQIAQSAHYEIEKELLQRRLKTKICLQVHDSLLLDGPKEEEKEIDSFIGIYLTKPPLLEILENELGRSVPILYEKEIII
ncbi:MAG TPA: hypothetical protein ENI23_02875, partial [bacterium]|nr:hypothetical protein [bacterium]